MGFISNRPSLTKDFLVAFGITIICQAIDTARLRWEPSHVHRGSWWATIKAPNPKLFRFEQMVDGFLVAHFRLRVVKG